VPDVSTEIAIVGAGPAGAHLATLLSSAGREVMLFDPKGAWEKPCGGGVTSRALKEFSFLLESSSYPKKLINRITMVSPYGRRVTLKVKEPFVIFSRKILNGMILDRAIEAGANFVKKAVSDFVRVENGWRIKTADGDSIDAKFLVGADGAASGARRKLLGIFPKEDLAVSFGFNVADEVGCTDDQGKPQEAFVSFSENLTGYIWAFPRPGVMNFGIASRLGERTTDDLRALLNRYVSDFYGGKMPDEERLEVFGAKIPVLNTKSWRSLKASGDRWALVGDAAGFVDPITGEGIFYALKSAELLSESFTGEKTPVCPSETGQQGSADAMPRSDSDVTSATDYGDVTRRYEKRWRKELGTELERASRMVTRCYHGTFLGHVFSDATIFLAKYHHGVRCVLLKAVIGEQSYVNLKRDLLRSAFRIA